jgi:S1-C subfamily serine protease
VIDVQKETGAERAGIQKGDIIQRIDGIVISKFSDLKGFLNTKSPEDKVEVEILRDNIQKTLTVTLEKLTTIVIPILGTLKELSKEALNNFDIDYGLRVSELSESHRKDWESDGISEGSFVTAINDMKINSINDVQKALEKYSNQVLTIALIKNDGEKVVYRFR